MDIIEITGLHTDTKKHSCKFRHLCCIRGILQQPEQLSVCTAMAIYSELIIHLSHVPVTHPQQWCFNHYYCVGMIQINDL